MTRRSAFARNVAMMFIIMALAVRIAVPSGWMPSSERGIALTVCVGGDSQTVWMDRDGSLHEDELGQPIEHSPCAFAGAALAIELPMVVEVAIIAPMASPVASLRQTGPNIGQGLAAPPPPATGPPSFI